MQTCFSEFQARKNVLKCPKFETSMSGACFPDWGPGHRPSHRPSWRPPRHLLKAEAPQPRPGPFPPPSAAAWSLRRLSPETRRPLWASGGPRRRGRCDEGTTNVVGSWALCPFNRQTNDECFWTQQLQTVQSKIYSHTNTNTANKFQYIWFPTKCLQWNNLLLPIPTFFRVEHGKRGFLMVLAKNLVILEKTGFHFYDP